MGVGGGCQTWLCHLAETGGNVAWLCRKLWVAGLMVNGKSLGVGHAAGQGLSPAKAVAALAVAAYLPVAKLMPDGWNGVGRVRNCAIGVGPMCSRLWWATFQRMPPWFCFLRWRCEVGRT